MGQALFYINGESLTLEAVGQVAHEGVQVGVDSAAWPKVIASRALVENILSADELVYSINTGFGALSRIAIDKADVNTLQLNFVRSHAAGTGPILSKEVTRAMTLLRANTLVKGYSGVRPEVIELLVEMLNKGVHPRIPAQGSLGASGDLAPLAHLALVLIGEGEAEYKGAVLPGDIALREAGLTPVVLQAKEGLALVNGTQMMTAIGALTLLDSERLCQFADIAGCMSVEGFLGSHQPFLEAVQTVRPHPGQVESAAFCRKLLLGSEIAASHINCKKVQDPYSFRCIPQVHGAVRDTVAYVREILTRELNAATDNPLLFPETGHAVSQGNFHGEPVAFAMDFLAIAMRGTGQYCRTPGR